MATLSQNEELTQLREKVAALEDVLRVRIYLMHGARMQHYLYGDDNKLDCNTCFRDYRNCDMEQVYAWERQDALELVKENPSMRAKVSRLEHDVIILTGLLKRGDVIKSIIGGRQPASDKLNYHIHVDCFDKHGRREYFAEFGDNVVDEYIADGELMARIKQCAAAGGKIEISIPEYQEP
jgi:hypothetical protein